MQTSTQPTTNENTHETLERLRHLISAKQGLHDRSYLSCHSLSGAGIPRGAITQICGLGKVEATVQILRENPGHKVAWVESRFELNPLAMAQRDIDLTQVLFTEAGEHMVWSCHQVLKSHLFPIVVLKEAPFLDEQDFSKPSHDEILLRKLQLAAEKSQSALILLTEEYSPHWPVSLVLKAYRPSSSENVQLEVLRQRL